MLLGLWLVNYESPEKTGQIYSAWCRANPDIHISIEDWSALRGEQLLPGQPAASSEGSAATGMAIGIAVGTAAGAGR